jgi:hypothetical protein
VDPLADEAVAGVADAVRSLLPAVAPPVLAPTVAVSPLQIGPTGIGGFVGMNAEPYGEILGRRVRASVDVVVASTDAAQLDAAATRTAGALVGAGRATLAGAGLLGLSLDARGVDAVAGTDAAPRYERRLTFSALFEYLARPQDAAGAIASVPLELDLDGVLRSVPIDSAFAARFDVVDDAAATGGPSDWQFADGALQQLSAIGGGSAAAAPDKPGAALVAHGIDAGDGSLRAELSSAGPQGIGLVFRFQDADNFGFLLLQQAPAFRLLAKKRDGAFSALADGGRDDTAGFAPGAVMRVRVDVHGDRVDVALDGAPVLSGADPALPPHGGVGFFTHRNPQASFYALDVVA